MNREETEFQVQDLVYMSRKYWKLLLIPSIITFVIIFFLYGLVIPKKYESSAILKIGTYGNEQIESVLVIREIMHSQAMLEVISENVVGKKDKNYVNTISKKIFYKDISGLLKIYCITNSPEESYKLANVAANVVFKHHNEIGANIKKRAIENIKNIKETVSPTQLSIGLYDLRFEPTRIETFPILNAYSVPLKNKEYALAGFFIVFFINLLVAFYLYGRENDK